jgi:NitT/TauT family transport system permease protein
MLKKKSEKAAIISKEHEEYLKSIKKERNFIRITQILIFVFGIIFWETAAQKNIIDTFLTSSPGAILELIVKFINDGIIKRYL